MANRPTRQQIVRRVASDFQHELGTTASRVRHTIERGYTEAVAGVSHGLHGRLDQAARDMFPATVSDEKLPALAKHYGLTANPATRATFYLSLFGTIATVVPAGTVWVRPDGALFKVVEEVVLGGGDTLAQVRAVVAGAAGSTEAGVILTVQSPISGLVSEAAVAGGEPIVDGADQESPSALRRRLEEHLAEPSLNGGPGSYEAWAKQVSGVTRAWEFGKVPKPGQVTVVFVRDDDGEGSDIIPSAGEIADVLAAIEAKAPLHVQGLQVIAPIEVALTIEISDLDPSTTEVRAAIKAALLSAVKSRAQVARADGEKFFRNWLIEAIGGAAGEVSHTLTTPSGDISLNQFELVTLVAADITFL